MPVSRDSTKKSTPAKGSRAKKPQAKKVAKSSSMSSKKTRKEIKQAATNIEQLIKEEMVQSSASSTPLSPAYGVPNGNHPYHAHIVEGDAARMMGRRKTLLWIVVIAMTCAIILLWVINMRSLIYDVTKSDTSPEGELVNIAQNDLSQIFDQLLAQNAALAATSTNNATATPTTTQVNTSTSILLDKLINAIEQTSSTTSTDL